MRRITIARTTKVYGRRSASCTIHMLVHQALTRTTERCTTVEHQISVECMPLPSGALARVGLLNDVVRLQ